MSSEIGIGSTVWVFDPNHRIYGPDKGTPIYREYWRPRKIAGETRVSWLLEWGDKFPKKAPHVTAAKNGFGGYRVALSAQEVDDYCWVDDLSHHVVRKVQECRDAVLLRQIAELVGYKADA